MSVDQSKARADGDIIGRDKLVLGPFNVFSASPELADKEIEKQLCILRSNQHFPEFNGTEKAKSLAASCISGHLAGGSASIRCKALAWCARILSIESAPEAEVALDKAKELGDDPQIEIAAAFFISKESGKADALKSLAKIESVSARSAGLFVVSLHETGETALQWFQSAGLQAEDLDAYGKNRLLSLQLEQADLDGSGVTASACTEDDCTQAPIMRINLAFTELLKIVPKEYRQLVHTHPPFDMATFELASGTAAFAVHKRAQELFKKAAEIFSQLGLNMAAEIAEEYELWLALRHPELSVLANDRLRDLLRDPSKSLKFVPFAWSFSAKLDLMAVEKEIDRQVALSGGPTSETAVARFVLALKQSSSANVAKYIARHRGDLEGHIDQRALAVTEIEMLAKSGQRDAAKKVQEELAASTSLSEEDISRLELILSEAPANDLITAARILYDESNSLPDLRNLVGMLHEANDWEQLTKFAEKLHSETNSLLSAEYFVSALVKSGRDEDALTFLAVNRDFLTHSPQLRVVNCWALYRTGQVLDAKSALNKISKGEDFDDYRILRRNIAVASGDWNELSQIVGEEAANIEDRSALQLLQAAYLGFQIGAHAAKTLLFAAAQKGSEDAKILSAAYSLAANAALEDDETVAAWLHKAAELSGSDGPIYQTSLEEILEKKPDWDRHYQSTQGLVRNGEAPMFIAAQLLNHSLTEMILMPLLANQQEPDPRQRIAIPAFSGKRPRQDAPPPQILGLDVSALLILGGLQLLEPLKKAGYEIRIPHSTLGWLFSERQRAAFHQPSRFLHAQSVQELLTDERLAILSPSISPDTAMCAQVGDELASMICQAKADADDKSAARSYVVRSYPVPRLGTLLSENADLDIHHEVLVSCLGVVDKLASLGKITSAEAKRARSFLVLNEKQWPNEPEIDDGATLYLDRVSVSYLQNFGLIEKLCKAGFSVLISNVTVTETNSLLALRRISSQVDEAIESIRTFLETGIADGDIKLGAIRHNDDDQSEGEFRNHPTIEAMLLAKDCDAVVIDDRFINQHINIDGPDGSRRPIYTSLDLLKLWLAHEIIGEEDYQEAMTNLRLGGGLFVEVDSEEVISELQKCKVVEGKIQESAELRSIREGFVFARMTGILQTPDETLWLDRSIASFILAYRRLWSLPNDIEDVIAAINWLMPLIDVRGWLHCFPSDQAHQILHKGREQHIKILIFPPGNIDNIRRNRFFIWVNEHIVKPLKRETPGLYDDVVEAQKEMLLTYLDENFLDLDGIDG